MLHPAYHPHSQKFVENRNIVNGVHRGEPSVTTGCQPVVLPTGEAVWS
jgi:hypothetical protein